MQRGCLSVVNPNGSLLEASLIIKRKKDELHTDGAAGAFPLTHEASAVLPPPVSHPFLLQPHAGARLTVKGGKGREGCGRGGA